MIRTITDLTTWLRDYGDRTFNIRRHKKVFTPYESEQKFMDELTTEDLGDYIILEAIELPDKDVLLGCKGTWDEDVRDEDNDLLYVDTKFSGIIEYFKLSEIDLRREDEEEN